MVIVFNKHRCFQTAPEGEGDQPVVEDQTAEVDAVVVVGCRNSKKFSLKLGHREGRKEENYVWPSCSMQIGGAAESRGGERISKDDI